MEISEITEKDSTGLNICCGGAVRGADADADAGAGAGATDGVFRYAAVGEVGRADDLNKSAADAAAALIASASIFSRRSLAKKFLIFGDVNSSFSMHSFISHSGHADRVSSLTTSNSVFATATLTLLFTHTPRFLRYLRSFRRKILSICLNSVSVIFVSSKISLNESHKSVS